jgi:hypothetical protein
MQASCSSSNVIDIPSEWPVRMCDVSPANRIDLPSDIRQIFQITWVGIARFLDDGQSPKT